MSKVQWWVLLSLFSLSPITETLYTGALPEISSYFHIDEWYAQLSSSLYFLGFAFGVLSLGRISDIIGRRPVILCGIAVYVISVLCSVFTYNIHILMFLRFTTAFGASVGSVVAQAMARDSYEGRVLSCMYASLAIWLGFAPALGSFIGGYVIEYLGWRYIFIVLGVVSALLLVLNIKYLPETNIYIEIARRNKYWTIFKHVMKDRSVLLYAFIIGAFNGMAFGFYLEAPFVFIDTMGMNPSEYGRLALLLSGAAAIGSFNGRYWINKGITGKKLILVGLGFSMIGCTLFGISSHVYVLDPTMQYHAITLVFVPMMLHMLGHGLLVPMSLRYALENYSTVTGSAGSVFGFLYYVLVALISLIVSMLHSDDTKMFALLFCCLSVCSTISFYLIQRFDINKKAVI